MVLFEKKENCTGCSACVYACKQRCITMHNDAEGFWYPEVDESKCIDCGLCQRACPIITPLKTNPTVTAYAAVNTDDAVRMQSSSGGVFSLLAELVLKQDGVVFGAGFDENMSVQHMCIDNESEIGVLRSSKYVQSKIGDAYCNAKQFLDEGRLVLFSGTPCQIAGLRAYLKKDYENLICQDLICHGVPSPAVWQQYLHFRSAQAESEPTGITFRNKAHSWKKYSMHFSFANGNVYESEFTMDAYMRSFLADLSLRPSCYQCHFKTLNRHADITLADFWGVQKVAPDFDDDKGTSLVLIHSEKGANIWKQLQPYIKSQEVSLEESVQYNPSAYRASKLPVNRDAFMTEIMTSEFSYVVKKYTKQKFFIKAIRFTKRCIKRMLRL